MARMYKGSLKKGTRRSRDMKNIDAETLLNNCAYNRYPIEGHPTIKIGLNLNGEQMFYCQMCGHIVGALIAI